jgi:hypothetical protein
MNLFGPKRVLHPDQVDRIKSWTRERWGLGDDVTIMVTELECRESGCPPIETVIAVLEGPGITKQYKIHKTTDEIGRHDVERLGDGGGSHRHAEGAAS